MAPLDLHYVDPRLVAQYDLENASRLDTDFYLALARELGAQRVVDLGCGTGVLARDLAAEGPTVWAADPAAEMLAYARRQAGAERVQWLCGDSGVLGQLGADLAVMTGNVAQVFLDDQEWQKVLTDLHGALRPGGTLAFESRNPAVRAWEEWASAPPERLQTPHGEVETWLEVTDVQPGRVSFVGHNLFVGTGEQLSVPSTLRFRTQGEILTSLEGAGFEIRQVYGDWQRAPWQPSSPIMVFVAQCRALP